MRQYAPPGLAPGNGYSHAVSVEVPGRLVAVSGQIALDADGRLVGAGDAGAQTRRVLANVHTALREAGAGWEHVVKLGYYLRDLADLPAVRAARDQTLPAGIAPASTLVQVAGLIRDDLLVEIDALAVVPLHP
ncbi:RidA family protein [Actinomadura sp. PM05-2]|uniref:RidA family protein n=1 Tax=Actinomadura parmotrematis TaxID=2864039 RepID=A0ABS7FQ95_9ACTN|nr:RidA family protein [Actinomadura parmotrematis]